MITERSCFLRYRDGTGERTALPGEVGAVTLLVTDDGCRRTVTATASEPVTLLSYEESGYPNEAARRSGGGRNDRFFFNGYQSWTDTKEMTLSESERDVNRLPRPLVRAYAFDRYGDASFYPYRRDVLHGYDLFYVKGERNGFALNLNASNAYLIFEVSRRTGELTVRSDVTGKALAAGESFTVADYVYADSRTDGEALLDRYFPKKPIEKIFGYTSWYHYYQNINETILKRDLEALDDRFTLFQIDDGYETFVGDWFDVDPAKFPNGLLPIAEAARRKGLKAGIWLAPFAAEEKSRLVSEHPDWLVRGDDGLPVKAGSNWSGFYAVDHRNPEARAYIARCLRHYADMGFDFFKLDFLYAAHLAVPAGMTRGEAAAETYGFIRETLSDRQILGCGAALFSAAGCFDYMRIGPDVSLIFDDVWFMKYMHRERISTKVTLQNTVYRSLLDGRLFGNDPDVFLLRDEDIKLSPEQRRALITLNALFGHVLMTSDSLGDYDENKKERLAAALDLFRNGSVTRFDAEGRYLTVTYRLRGRETVLRYDTEKGVLL